MIKLFPCPRKLEQPQEPECPQCSDGVNVNTRDRRGNHQVKESHHGNEAVKDVEKILEVIFEAEPQHLEHHFEDEDDREHAVDEIYFLDVGRCGVLVQRLQDCVCQDRNLDEELEGLTVHYLIAIEIELILLRAYHH